MTAEDWAELVAWTKTSENRETLMSDDETEACVEQETHEEARDCEEQETCVVDVGHVFEAGRARDSETLRVTFGMQPSGSTDVRASEESRNGTAARTCARESERLWMR